VDRIGALFKNHHDALYRYLVRLSGDPDVAADAAQEAFVRLVERPPLGNSERPWLFKVATNYVFENRRTAARRARLIDGRAEETMGDAPHDPHSRVEALQRGHVVTAALERLSEKERVAILMREEGFSYREIADALGTTTGSVGTLLARALEHLARDRAFNREAL